MSFKILLAVSLFTTLASYAMAKPSFLMYDAQKDTTQGKTTDSITITDAKQLVTLQNQSVPILLRSDHSPDVFYHQSRQNNTLDQGSENLVNLFHMQFNLPLKGSRRMRSCPVTWVVEFKRTRSPAHLWRASCNGQGTTCKAPGSKLPGCQEILVTFRVLYFRGIRPDGSQIWQWVYEKLPIDCSCS